MTEHELISQIEDFAAAQDLAPATVTGRAVGNSRLYARLKGGASCSMRTAERLRQYMDSQNQVEAGEGAA